MTHRIGEAREGIALTSALALDRRAMLESLQLVVDRASQQPRAVVETQLAAPMNTAREPRSATQGVNAGAAQGLANYIDDLRN